MKASTDLLHAPGLAVARNRLQMLMRGLVIIVPDI